MSAPAYCLLCAGVGGYRVARFVKGAWTSEWVPCRQCRYVLRAVAVQEGA